MRIRVFSHDSNPAIDQPLCHKSLPYVADLLNTLRAFRIDERTVQLFPPEQTPGYYSETLAHRPRHWQPLFGSMQLVEGDIPGRKGQFSYPIPACGAHTRALNVWEINAVEISAN